MEFQGVRPDFVKYELRTTTGRPAWEKEVKKPGGFGRFLSGIGRLFGAVAAPLSFIFPPAALATAGMYGAASIGDQVQTRAYQKAVEGEANRSSQNVSFPGLGVSSGFQPVGAGVSPQDQMIMNVLLTRDNASMSMAHSI